MKATKRELLGSSFPYATDAIKVEDLNEISTKIDPSKFIHLIDITMFTLQFECMLRISKGSAIQIEHITIADDHYSLYIPKTKTDQNGDGRRVIVYCSETPHSSYKWLRLYLNYRQNCDNRCLFLTRTGGAIKPLDVRNRLKFWISSIGKDPNNYSTHSLRKGGAQTAALQ